jgi:NAD(P)-dependent dehydrogenase (short-subunit alcohol dehydrogenase family)
MGHELLPSKMNGIDFDTLNDEGDFSSLNRYSRSKLDNILLAKALARRMGCERVYVDVAHPGLVATEIGRSSKDMIGAAGDKAGQLLNAVLGYSAEEGALTQLYLATSPDRKSGCEGKILYSHRK